MSAERRTLLDRIMRPVRPAAVLDFHPPLRAVAERVWLADRKLRFRPALTLPTRMTVIRDPQGGLLLHSPIAPDSGLIAELRSLGEVDAMLAPNTFHYIFAGAYLSSFPQARLFVAPGLPERVASVPKGTVLDTDVPALSSFGLEHAVFGPIRGVSEVVLFHRPSATLVLTDLAFNLPRIEGVYNRLAWRLMGVPTRFGPSRTVRLTLLHDAARAGPYLAQILAWDFDRIIVAHGEILESNGKAEFQRAFASYLP